MNGTDYITEIMTKDLVTLHVQDSLETAEKKFKKYKIRHIPVVEGSLIKGIISYSDLLRISYADAYDLKSDQIDKAIYELFSIEQLMANNPICVQDDSTIYDVAQIFSEKEFHALPVLRNEELVGIVTTTDLMKYLVDNCA
ncbi:MAG: CBS domain-containing protein [Flavobacteriaceae bacterium]